MNLTPTSMLSLITDYAPLGSLDSFLRQNANRLEEDHLFKICQDVALGLGAMHARRIAHGDVKAANVLIFEESSHQGHFTAKLGDLGFSVSLDLENGNVCYRGTNLYNAPEIRGEGTKKLRDLNFLACDIYSYGLLVGLCLNLEIAFSKTCL